MNSTTEHVCSLLLRNCKTLKAIKQVHAYVHKTGLNNDTFLVGKLLLHCAVLIPDALRYARRLFLHIPEPDVFTYNTLIRGFSESDTPQDSFTTFVDMRRDSHAPPDSFSFAFILKAVLTRNRIKLETYGLLRGTLRAPAVDWMMNNLLVSNERSLTFMQTLEM
ncbi:hypothetical protein RJ639_022050 [Escallonia herrerae]|uniref:Pentatricopeptide repeat-containing protein n=1 Tax=Escallonia herrerae TaxID=1293975 RepID=A0AA89AF21_9ASTE|nr:hypothetical protein RJ639_022050 [Escallonia herrerae]